MHKSTDLLTALKNRATFALKNGPPSSQHFFATNALHPAAEGICGEKMFPGTLGAGPRESAKVASFESAVDMRERTNLNLDWLLCEHGQMVLVDGLGSPNVPVADRPLP